MIPKAGMKQLKARPSTRKHLYVMGGAGNKYFYKYDIEKNAWDAFAPVNRRHRHACVYADEKIFMIGGWNDRPSQFESVETVEAVETVESINVNSGEMKSLRPLNYPRANLSAVYLKNEIYALGGHIDDFYRGLITVEK